MSTRDFLVVRNGVEMPYAPPKKRRQLEAADAKHLAIWANDSDLPASARKRAQNERERRKRLVPDAPVVAVLEGSGGATTFQVHGVITTLEAWRPSKVLHPYSSGRLHHACKSSAHVQILDHAYQIIDADRVIGLPNETGMPERKDDGIWRHLRHAKDRGMDVMVIWPDGSTLTGRW